MSKSKSGTTYRPGAADTAVSRTGTIPAWLMRPVTVTRASSTGRPAVSESDTRTRASPVIGGVGDRETSTSREGSLSGP